MNWSVVSGTKDLIRFRAPIPGAIFLDIWFICSFHIRFSSRYTPIDFVCETRLMGIPPISNDGDVLGIEIVLKVDKRRNICKFVQSVLSMFSQRLDVYKKLIE